MIIWYYDLDIKKVMIYIKCNRVMRYNAKIKGQINMAVFELH